MFDTITDENDVNERKYNMYTGKNHTFVVCAYKENPHLEKAIRSVLNQTVKSKIIISTSTPNDHIKSLSVKYNIPMYVNPSPHSIGSDWNYGYNQADTELVTIVHQDDIYEKRFLEETLKALNKAKRPLFSFTDYSEIKFGKKVECNVLLIIKRIMNFPLRFKVIQNVKWIRRRILGFGCPICCPTVTCVKETLGNDVYDIHYKNSCDYKTWVGLSKKDGAFVYIPKKLLLHRIYAESTTTLNLTENIRKVEDYEILCSLWPKPIARMINKIYVLSEKSNQV